MVRHQTIHAVGTEVVMTMPSDTSQPSPRIFLSYARSDRDFAVALRDEMIRKGDER